MEFRLVIARSEIPTRFTATTHVESTATCLTCEHLQVERTALNIQVRTTRRVRVDVRVLNIVFIIVCVCAMECITNFFLPLKHVLSRGFGIFVWLQTGFIHKNARVERVLLQ